MKRLVALVFSFAILLPLITFPSVSAQPAEGCNLNAPVPAICGVFRNQLSESPMVMNIFIYDVGNESDVETVIRGWHDSGSERDWVPEEPPAMPGNDFARAHHFQRENAVWVVLHGSHDGYLIEIATGGRVATNLEYHASVYNRVIANLNPNEYLTVDMMIDASDLPGEYVLEHAGGDGLITQEDEDAESTALGRIITGTDDVPATPVAEVEGIEISDVEFEVINPDSGAVMVTFNLTTDERYSVITVIATCVDANGNDLESAVAIQPRPAPGYEYPLQAYILRSPGCEDVRFDVLPE